MEQLTARESEVANLIHLGNTNDEISCKLHISSETVKTHRKNLMQKLQARNSADITRIYIRKILRDAAVYVIIAAVAISVSVYLNHAHPDIFEILRTSLINFFEK